MSALGVGRGTAMYIGAILGPGVLVLPAAAVSAAGPASVVAWAALFVLSVPVACVYAVLAIRYPDGAGVATFATRAFGTRAGTVVGWWFYAAVPAGTAGGALAGGGYVAAAVGAGAVGANAATVLLLAVVFAGNHVGLQLSARVQMVLVMVLVAVLGVAMIAAGPHVRVDHFAPFTPAGWSAVGHAAALLFLAFSGWETACHLAGDFARPGRQVPAVTAITLVVVGVVYLGLAATTIGVLGSEAASPVALTGLLERGIGPAAPVVTGVLAVLVTAAALNTFVAAGGRLGAGLARDGGAPRWLTSPRRGPAVPHRSIAVQAAATVVITVVTATIGSLDAVLRIFAVLLTAVTVAGLLAAARLLPAGGLRCLAVTASGLTGLVLVVNGVLLLIPVAVAAAALGWTAASRRAARHAPQHMGRAVLSPHRTMSAMVQPTPATTAARRTGDGRSTAPDNPHPSQTRTCSTMDDPHPAGLAHLAQARRPCRHARGAAAMRHHAKRRAAGGPATTGHSCQPGPARTAEAVDRWDTRLPLNPPEETS